jgi:hypothetical protein
MSPSPWLISLPLPLPLPNFPHLPDLTISIAESRHNDASIDADPASRKVSSQLLPSKLCGKFVIMKSPGSRNNLRLSSHIITVFPAQKAHQTRHVVGYARAAQQDQVVGVLLDRLALFGAFFLAEFFVDEVPHCLCDWKRLAQLVSYIILLAKCSCLFVTHRPYNSRRIRIHSDMFARKLHRVARRQAAHGVLARRIVRQQREGFERHDGSGC